MTCSCNVPCDYKQKRRKRKPFGRLKKSSANLNTLSNIFIYDVLQEKLLSVYQELGSDNVEPLPFKVLVEHPLIQDVMAACQTYKALVSTNTVKFLPLFLLHIAIITKSKQKTSLLPSKRVNGNISIVFIYIFLQDIRGILNNPAPDIDIHSTKTMEQRKKIF